MYPHPFVDEIVLDKETQAAGLAFQNAEQFQVIVVNRKIILIFTV